MRTEHGYCALYKRTPFSLRPTISYLSPCIDKGICVHAEQQPYRHAQKRIYIIRNNNYYSTSAVATSNNKNVPFIRMTLYYIKNSNLLINREFLYL